MTRKYWFGLAPSFLLAIGIIISTAIAVLASESGWLVLAGPLLLALTIVGADVLSSRLRGEALAPSRSALVVAVAFLAACTISALSDPTSVATIIPVLGACGVPIILLRPDGRRKACRRF